MGEFGPASSLSWASAPDYEGRKVTMRKAQTHEAKEHVSTRPWTCMEGLGDIFSQKGSGLKIRASLVQSEGQNIQLRSG